MTKSVFTKEYKFMLEQLVKARKKAGLSQRELSEKQYAFFLCWKI